MSEAVRSAQTLVPRCKAWMIRTMTTRGNQYCFLLTLIYFIGCFFGIQVSMLVEKSVGSAEPVPWEFMEGDLRTLAEHRSSVDYFAAKGLGHRLVRMADSNTIAQEEGFVLRTHWGFCPVDKSMADRSQVEIFHHFFSPISAAEVLNTSKIDAANVSMGRRIAISNEVPGYTSLERLGKKQPCQCTEEKSQQDFRFYHDLQKRFRMQKDVESFYNKHFANSNLVIGLHVRAGNGEKGDFVVKKRGIADHRAFVGNATQSLLRLAKDVTAASQDAGATSTAAFDVFLATDTPSIVTRFRDALRPHGVRVVTYDQLRAAEGGGVPIIEGGGVCIDNWRGVLMDQMLLARSDVVVAGTPSSLTQSLPMSVKLEGSAASIASRRYCEFHPSGAEYKCFRDTMDWCCRGTTNFHKYGMLGTEFRRIRDTSLTGKQYEIKDRRIKRKKKNRRIPVPCMKTNCNIPQFWPREFELKKESSA